MVSVPPAPRVTAVKVMVEPLMAMVPLLAVVAPGAAAEVVGGVQPAGTTTRTLPPLIPAAGWYVMVKVCAVATTTDDGAMAAVPLPSAPAVYCTMGLVVSAVPSVVSVAV